MSIKPLKDIIAEVEELTRASKGEQKLREMRQGSLYSVMPLVKRNADGEIEAAAPTLWLYVYVAWKWTYISYAAGTATWVTDSSSGGNAVVVDSITAYLQTAQNGGNTVTQQNSYQAIATVEVYFPGVPQSGACGHGCATKTGYGIWCTQQVCC